MQLEPELDMVIIGAGFGGLRMLCEARKIGLSAKVLDAGADVGGTWYWNRYPGARTDCESWVYCYAFDKGLQDEWDWLERYPSQSQVHAYLRHVADRFDLHRDIELNTRVEGATFDEQHDVWIVNTQAGDRLVCRTLVSAAGPLSVPQEPSYLGLSSFRGDWYLTARWPSEEVDLAGKRVAVIGTGASGIQLIPLVAAVASELTVFHRTANYVLPARSYVLDDLQRDAIKTGYSDIWEQVGRSAMAMPINPANRLIGDVDDAELQRILEAAWEEGGFRFLLETFDDIFVDPESNSAVSEFIRNKIRTIVRDPATAELLCPTTDHPIGAKRPPLGHYYYEAFNRDNVKVVDVNGNPIEDVTEAGIRMADGTEREFDVIIFATGFDALTGALTHIDVRGNDGLSIAEKWEHGPRTHLGTAIDGFPNFFMVFGPQSPFANAPAMIEAGVEAIGAAVSRLRDSGQTRMEVTAEAVEEYASMLDLYFNATIFPAGAKLRAWWLGTNVEGKALGVGVNFGGFPTWAASLKDEATGGFEHYRFSTGEEADPSAWTRREPANADAG